MEEKPSSDVDVHAFLQKKSRTAGVGKSWSGQAAGSATRTRHLEML
jgi:hypothetical protein